MPIPIPPPPRFVLYKPLAALAPPFLLAAAPATGSGVLRLYSFPGAAGTVDGRTTLASPPFGRKATAGGAGASGPLRLYSFPGATATRDGRTTILSPPFGREAATVPASLSTTPGLSVGGLLLGSLVVTDGLGWAPPPVPTIYADVPTAARARIKADPMLTALAEVYYNSVPRLAPYPFIVVSYISSNPTFNASGGDYWEDEVYQYDVIDTDEARGELIRNRASWLLSPGFPRLRIADGYVMDAWPRTLGGFQQPGQGRRGATVYHSIFQVTYTVARGFRRVQN